MKSIFLNNRKKLYICSAFTVMAVLLMLLLSLSHTSYATDMYGKPVVVSLGDSYSSGEGIEDFYGNSKKMSERVEDPNWLAHRSENSWPGRLKVPGLSGTLADHREDGHWYFVAASGATTFDLKGEQKKHYCKLAYSYDILNPLIGKWERGDEYLDPQLDIFDELESQDKLADYVTITIGGNDADFAGIMTKAALCPSYVKSDNYLIRNYIPYTLLCTWNDFYKNDGIRDHIKQAYRDIHDKAGQQAKIIVAGYPRLLDETGKGLPFSKGESEQINAAVTQFNKELKSIVNSCKAEGIKICFVSVEDEFFDHGAYSGKPGEDGAWINSVIVGSMPQDISDWLPASAYSIHPNTYGAKHYAKCVQDKIDQIESDGGKSEWPEFSSSDERDIVLVLDVSGSMNGTPIEETKKAAKEFVKTVLKEDASIGIVIFDDSAQIVSDFSMSESYLIDVIDSINSGGGTNTGDGLLKAEEMLSKSKARKKIIVLMSDGCPTVGKGTDQLISDAGAIKEKKIYIYTLGFFQSLADYEKQTAQYLMGGLASEGCHYEVTNAESLVFFFGDIADQINGTKYIYIRIACPVDVKVAYNGETLSSKGAESNVRTDFGTLTFEENRDEDESGDTEYNEEAEESDTRVKILRLKEGPSYDVQINGNGEGRMNYTIGFMDENGEYSDMRQFENITIKRATVIDTVAENASETIMSVDRDGDGEYDTVYKAKANSSGRIVEIEEKPASKWYVFLIIAAIIVIAAAVPIIIIKKKKAVPAAAAPAPAAPAKAPVKPAATEYPKYPNETPPARPDPAAGAHPPRIRPDLPKAPNEVPKPPETTRFKGSAAAKISEPSETGPAGKAETQQFRFCGYCGAKFDSSAKICGKCGKPLK